MSSFRTHFRSTPDPSENQRTKSTRLPTNPTAGKENKSKASQHVAKLSKRTSRSIAPPDDRVEQTTRSASTSAPTPVTAATHNLPAAPRKSSVTPASEDVSSQTTHRNKLPPPPPINRTPSLVSGSSASTFDSPRSTGLRRKPSSIDRYAAQKRADTAPIDLERATMNSRNEAYQEAFDDTILGISMPSTKYLGQDTISSGHVYGRDSGRDREWHVTRNITPPTAAYAPSATPSTRYTDSPFSHAPTPSSASSYSPGIIATSGSTSRNGPQSPIRARPPPTGRTTEKGDGSRLGLQPVRESSTSSSNSTVKPSVSNRIPRKEVPRKTPSAPPATGRSTVSRVPSYARPTVASTQSAKPPVQVPPELAHLNVEPPTQLSLNKPLPPLRPSRDNTPSITDMNQQSRVVQSDLPRLYTTYHKRVPSQETPVSATSPTFKQRFGISSRSSSRQPSPRIDSAISPPPSARVFNRGPTPDNHPPQTRRLQRKDSPAVGTAPSPSKSPRFAFFSRKPKADAGKVTEKPKRPPVKGPAAGTGHEYYGRFAARGRSGSATSGADFRSPSADSSTSSVPRPTTDRAASFGSERSDMEEFVRERQTPVILRGSGSTWSNDASVSDMAQSSVQDSSHSSSVESYPTPQLLPSAMSNDRGFPPAKRPVMGRRLPSADSSEDDVAARYPTLAARRSFGRLSQGDGKPPVRMPAPIDTSVPQKQQSVDSYGHETSAWPQSDSTLISAEDPFAGKEGLWLRPQPAEVVKPARKWNFFQRAQASPRPKGKAKAVAAEERPPLTAHQAPYQGMAHYAMMDPVEPIDLYEVEQILQENETSPEESMSEGPYAAKLVPYERRHNGLLPSPHKPQYDSRDADFKARPNPPPIIVRHGSSESPELMRARTAVPQPMAHVVDISRSPSMNHRSEQTQPSLSKPVAAQANITPEMTSAPFGDADGSNENSPRQPRLSPIGRIPAVVSKRDRDRKLPDNSFSRPFARTQPHPSVKPPGALYNQIRELASPIESGGSQPVSSTSTRSDGLPGSSNNNPTSASTNRTSMDMHPAQVNNDFITFTPRKNSEVSYTSSSANGSYLAALAGPQLDDPWTEYNDLLDDMMPQKTPISAGSSLGAPFQYASMLYGPNGSSVPTPLNFNFSPPPAMELPPPPRSHTTPAVLSVPQQIARFMQPSMSPLVSPGTISDLFDAYGNRSSTYLASARSSVPHPAHSSVSGPDRNSLAGSRASMASSRNSRMSAHSRSASLPEANPRNSQSSLTASARFKRDTQLLDIAEDDTDAGAAMANLRFGALVTSKWLSFGRILFSPAHNEVVLANEPTVLIVDGLGPDWSYYVAQSYPSANICYLGPSATKGSTAWPGVNQTPPPKWKHYPHANLSAAFPFPKGFFTAVLFRFPVATTDAAYHACIYECKRVLRPGGHLEIAVLDLDLTNMGSRARMLVRDLKTRIQDRDQSISLRNLSDVLVRLLGQRGFEEVQRCVVGVPAAGRIPRSQDISKRGSANSGNEPSRKGSRSSSDNEFSFPELLENARMSQVQPGKENDEGITKMVAKVGRWWYSNCYEASSLQSSKSIWTDHALLRECEKQQTSFRLLICHAQKPTQTRRRTVSV